MSLKGRPFTMTSSYSQALTTISDGGMFQSVGIATMIACESLDLVVAALRGLTLRQRLSTLSHF